MMISKGIGCYGNELEIVRFGECGDWVLICIYVCGFVDFGMYLWEFWV